MKKYLPIIVPLSILTLFFCFCVGWFITQTARSALIETKQGQIVEPGVKLAVLGYYRVDGFFPEALNTFYISEENQHIYTGSETIWYKGKMKVCFGVKPIYSKGPAMFVVADCLKK